MGTNIVLTNFKLSILMESPLDETDYAFLVSNNVGISVPNNKNIHTCITHFTRKSFETLSKYAIKRQVKKISGKSTAYQSSQQKTI